MQFSRGYRHPLSCLLAFSPSIKSSVHQELSVTRCVGDGRDPVLVGALDHREYVVSKMAKKLVKPPNDDVGQSIDGQWGDSQPTDRARRHSAMAEQRAATQYGVIQTRTRPSGPCAQSVREIRDKISYLSLFRAGFHLDAPPVHAQVAQIFALLR